MKPGAKTPKATRANREKFEARTKDRPNLHRAFREAAQKRKLLQLKEPQA